MDAAVVAIEEHGPDVTTEQIAGQAGVSRPGLYRHFDGKDDLQAAIAARSVERLVTELEPVWRPSGRPREMLERAIAAHLRWLAEHANVYLYLKRNSLPTGGDSVESASTNVRSVVSAHVTQMLVDGSLGAEIPPATAHPLAWGLIGMVDAAAAHWLDEPHGFTVEQLGAQLTEACWAVIGVTIGSRAVEALDTVGVDTA
ncbi:TetR/AcrR family transcriptional regulator [Actinomycetospora termitidis]|uniref:TetR/AcrR family transcriptional regulator n=1 Tax=Actinomycetospora termitidis TaxID=3053470 RepID=A0ABT7MAA8_9PSEU|nr:TetR/AcrR family transcriptional regulator [Actinomycetospora sp. Odt1-22]MDL5157590.1 TetR/AcrR family transcriptional regulator [Actinomycetospora sp. Odt1-22]